MKWTDAEDIAIALAQQFPGLDPLTVRFTDLRTHVLAYKAIHEKRKDAMVSIAKHCLAMTPNHPRNPFDWLSTRTRGWFRTSPIWCPASPW